jgi:hypothetical protein
MKGVHMLPSPIGFYIADNVFQRCDEVIEWLNVQDQWNPSVVGSGDGTVSDARTSDTIFLPFLSFALPDLIFDMNKTVWQHLDNYARTWNFGFQNVEHVSIQRYNAESNQHYDVHVDSDSTLPRTVSAVLYLNTVSGGETHFPLFDFSVSPLAGRLAIFPSNYIYAHAARVPNEGTKYAAAYWAR